MDNFNDTIQNLCYNLGMIKNIKKTMHISIKRFSYSNLSLFNSSSQKIIQQLRDQNMKLKSKSLLGAYKQYQNLLAKAEESLGNESQEILLREQITPPIPGLFYIRNFVQSEQKFDQLQNNCYKLYSNILQKQKQKQNTYFSYNHNLASNKYYKLVNLQDSSFKEENNQSIDKVKKLDGMYFKDYGSIGHDLTYFIENKSIPYFVRHSLISRLEDFEAVKEIKKKKVENQTLNWRLTFNIYKYKIPEETAFLWHKDIAANGFITFITTVLGEALFEIRHEKEKDIVYKLRTKPGSLVILSGQVWEKWQHRVLKCKTQNSTKQCNENEVQRISLVLGCR